MKKTSAILFCIFCIAVLTTCGGDNASEDAQSKPPVFDASATTDAEQGKSTDTSPSAGTEPREDIELPKIEFE